MHASLQSARSILPKVFNSVAPSSVLEVGCEDGAWLSVAAELGARELVGVDQSSADLCRPLDLGRRFDLVLSFEVGSRLAPEAAETFVASLVRHGDTVVFSAAIPGQDPDASANAQWPAYWASLFADHGYAASDALRTRSWLDADVEPRYAQNMVVFVREGRLPEFPLLAAAQVPAHALLPLVHPQIFTSMLKRASAPTPGHTNAHGPAGSPQQNGHELFPDNGQPHQQGPTEPEIHGFVTAVHATEIVADPSILSSYVSAFGDTKLATLVIYAPDRQAEDLLAKLGPALAAAGISGEVGPNTTLLCVPQAEGERFLAERAHVLLTRHPASAPLAAVTHTGPEAAGLLSALATGQVAPPARKDGLGATVVEKVIRAAGAPDVEDNLDRIVFPDGMWSPPSESWPGGLEENLRLGDGIEPLWDRVDPESRDVLASILAYRVLGPAKVRMAVGPFARLEAMVEQIREHMLIQPNTIDPHFLDWMLDEYDLRYLGLPIRLHSHRRLLINTFMLEQYRTTTPVEVAVRSGDVVIDGGGCWGETALHFAFLAGAAGRVHTFEFEPGNLSTLTRNLELNPELAARIRIHQAALWHTSGEQLAYNPNSGGTSVNAAGDASRAQTFTAAIDSLVQAGQIERVDFIKLDVEGSELAALQGAESTLRRFKPRLAISAYHRDDDLIVLPAFIEQLGLGYRFAVRHFTMYNEETVLFAWCED